MLVQALPWLASLPDACRCSCSQHVARLVRQQTCQVPVTLPSPTVQEPAALERKLQFIWYININKLCVTQTHFLLGSLSQCSSVCVISGDAQACSSPW